MAAEGTLVPLGVVIGAHGVRGELRVKLYNPESELLPQLRKVQLRHGGKLEERVIRSARPHKDLVLLTFDGCNDRNQAEAMRGTELCVPRSALPKLAAGEHYLVDLVGLRAQLPSGEDVGLVESVIPYPSSDALCVRTERGILEVPMLEPYFVEARPEAGILIVDHLADLDLDAPPAKPQTAKPSPANPSPATPHATKPKAPKSPGPR